MSAKIFALDLSNTSVITLLFYTLISIWALWSLCWRIYKRRMIELASKLPGPSGLPLIGSAHEILLGSAHDIFEKVNKRGSEYNSKILKAWGGWFLFVFLLDPDDIEAILSSHVHINKSPEYGLFKPWLGDGLLISTGAKWRAHRKLIAPTFHINILKSFIDLFNKNSRETCEKLRQEKGKEFDCHDYLSEATVEMLLETAMGVSKKTLGESGYDYALAVMKMCDILHLRHTKLWYRPDIIFFFSKYRGYQKKLLDTIHNITRKVVKIKKEAFARGIRGSLADVPEDLRSKLFDRTEVKTVVDGLSFGQSTGLKDDLDFDDDIGEKKRMSFLDQLIESSQSGVVINDEEIKEQVDTIMFEGHDTTAAASSFFLCQMAAHPDIQEKVVQELYEIFGNSDRPATFADTLEMKYLERCLMETLRLFPPVPMIARVLTEEVPLKSGYILPAGSRVIIGTYKLHRDPDLYDDPEVFNPDNFLPERSAKRHYYGFIPFSAGPRSCVGRKYAILKLKILLSTILRNFIIRSDLREKDYQLQGDIILKRADGFKVRLESRKPLCQVQVVN